MTDSTVLTTGKYAGTKLADVPASHLLWLYENKRTGIALGIYIRDNLELLRQEANKKQ